MSKDMLLKKIKETNRKLCFLVQQNNYDLQQETILKCSQQLDTLILTYMNLQTKDL